MQSEAIPNLAATSGHGAGIRATQTITDKQVQVVITGNIGPNAFRALSAAGITIITGASGKVKDVIEKYQKGLLSETKKPNVKGHSGMGTKQGWRGV
jgi:predicted Fe-Mo cluster-binding NifX family protein